MVLALVVATLVGQTVMEWTDPQGEVHYTDDASTIPRGAKVRVTRGEDLTVVASSPDAGVRPPRPGAKAGGPPPPQKDRCAEAKKRVTELEEKLEKAKKADELALLRWRGDCQAVLRTHGQAEYARCTARGRPSPQPPASRAAALEAELDPAREVLRRAQVGGCLE